MSVGRCGSKASQLSENREGPQAQRLALFEADSVAGVCGKTETVERVGLASCDWEEMPIVCTITFVTEKVASSYRLASRKYSRKGVDNSYVIIMIECLQLKSRSEVN